jgi:hypothetical protein
MEMRQTLFPLSKGKQKRILIEQGEKCQGKVITRHSQLDWESILASPRPSPNGAHAEPNIHLFGEGVLLRGAGAPLRQATPFWGIDVSLCKRESEKDFIQGRNVKKLN